MSTRATKKQKILEANYRKLLDGKSKEELVEHCISCFRVTEASSSLILELIKDRARLLAGNGDMDLFNRHLIKDLIEQNHYSTSSK